LAYYGNEAYDFSLFESRDYGTSAPAYEPEERPRQKSGANRNGKRPAAGAGSKNKAQNSRKSSARGAQTHKKSQTRPVRKDAAANVSGGGFVQFIIDVKRAIAQTEPTKAMLAQTRMSAWRAVKIISVTVVLFCMISSLIYCRVTIDNIGREITAVETAISEAKSEEVRLQTQLDSMISLDKVEDYAVNTLGMVKLENYKITYFTFCDEDAVVFSGDKEYK